MCCCLSNISLFAEHGIPPLLGQADVCELFSLGGKLDLELRHLLFVIQLRSSSLRQDVEFRLTLLLGQFANVITLRASLWLPLKAPPVYRVTFRALILRRGLAFDLRVIRDTVTTRCACVTTL
jgi:hypothetical protein